MSTKIADQQIYIVFNTIYWNMEKWLDVNVDQMTDHWLKSFVCLVYWRS